MENGELKIAAKNVGEFTVYVLSGELVVSTILELKNLFLNDLKYGRIYAACDLKGVTFIDSAGVGLISNMNKKVNAEKGHFVLFNVPPPIKESLDKTGLSEIISIVKNEKEFSDNFIL
ncbi:MAG: hypothetical protein A2268_05750 [Candidatus Raymondbacteria bacterium RifOxyA12_full_50_37]|uniref:Anti-sigma factor antagonist n=1 Tax=Candidatus Raymondbacteria bacterium RIFOXYD12_FULL_49_13 TaxID=1817890 RepID=A0A1F7FFR6_UNCRA|nr:MAG: hypothetical protein A2268_05750 [Candidatus Raymondbacteria bacterium RifOxyA12_full_50_37]OGJ94246.1 MAG: hypothetical protein A2248_14685 [Candidatus Raymondbacteria bacterium RIFOXYA2_FULL_49_16]OGJ94764.1 MAG: hypothetical protein A2487_01865 [Candidatus Raymondbacteria bacterium RifOxyC12_full_50_8]OGJ99076.1 MAG: hypothetical protein A2453_11095 [Candidatus Raymondbacteria bacterium RIFOXYC2_FULL_50_21]OGK05448.1 MAG: hypothetical protein A2519_03365 [Candidatus Raymondbacteria b